MYTKTPVLVSGLLIFLAVALSLTGCRNTVATFMAKDFERSDKNYEDPRLYEVKAGDSKERVKSILGEPSRILWVREYKDGTVEAWEYEKWTSSIIKKDSVARRYWVYFLNDRMCDWEEGLPEN